MPLKEPACCLMDKIFRLKITLKGKKAGVIQSDSVAVTG